MSLKSYANICGQVKRKSRGSSLTRWSDTTRTSRNLPDWYSQRRSQSRGRGRASRSERGKGRVSTSRSHVLSRANETGSHLIFARVVDKNCKTERQFPCLHATPLWPWSTDPPNCLQSSVSLDAPPSHSRCRRCWCSGSEKRRCTCSGAQNVRRV